MRPSFSSIRFASIMATVLVLAACTGTAAPAATFGPGATAAPVAAPTAAQPTAAPTAAPTAVPTAAPTPFVAGTVDQPREIAVTMTDTFRFEPAAITVQAGETVKFVLTNAGVLDHDFTIGDAEAQEHHAMEMADGGMHHGGDLNAAMVMSGMSHDLVFTFDADPAEWLIGCHVSGHYEAGMNGTLQIVASMG